MKRASQTKRLRILRMDRKNIGWRLFAIEQSDEVRKVKERVEFVRVEILVTKVTSMEDTDAHSRDTIIRAPQERLGTLWSQLFSRIKTEHESTLLSASTHCGAEIAITLFLKFYYVPSVVTMVLVG